MEEELPKLKAAPSFKRITRFDSSISRGGSETDLPRYTSLKDLMQTSSPKYVTSYNDPGCAFDCGNICIRNELVKHAASAYVQSATVNPGKRDHGWIRGLWEQMRVCCVGLGSFWQVHVRRPLQALCRPVTGIFNQVVGRIRSDLRGMGEIT